MGAIEFCLLRSDDGVRMGSEITTAAGIENVLIRAGECAVTVLPEIGGKIASIRIGERELMQPPLAPIGRRDFTMGFDQSDASGWDECLPSVAACSVETESGSAEIPDHGDLWRVEWIKAGSREQGVGSNKPANALVALIGKCFSLPLELERRIELSETEDGWRLNLSYLLRNKGEDSMPWSWAAHPLFVVEEGDRIVLPDSIMTLRLEGSGGGRLGKGGDAVRWPLATLTNGSTTDLSVAAAPDSGVGDKLFAGPLEQTENWCELVRSSAGVRIRVTFDTAATPYLGLWICYGGWPEKPGPKQVCVAMEPSTAPVDSLAVTGPWSRVLAPGECFSWAMEVEIEKIER
jgi:galactose mutarotase-like enzyme